MILLLAGTSDAKELALKLKKAGFSILATTVTDNGTNELAKVGIRSQVCRLTPDNFIEFIDDHEIKIIVDASHPYAEAVSRNAIEVANSKRIPYIRYERKSLELNNQSKLITYVDSYQAAAQLAAKKNGVIMLTTGSKTLPIFVRELLGIPETRVIIRMLPTQENIELCNQFRIPQKDIVAIQGPFSKEFNSALFKQFGVTVIVTKETGKQGSLQEKLTAANDLGIETILIRRPKIDYQTVYASFSEVINHLKEEKNLDFHTDFKPITVQPQEIEKNSFLMIDEEIGEHDFTDEQYPIVQRVIHASADFEFGRSLVFHERAIKAGIEAIRNGRKIVADVQMVQVGVSKKRIEKFGGEVNVYISNSDVVKEAKELNTTRAIVAMRKAVREAEGGIFLVGNAPTALLELIRLIKEGEAKPGLIIGFPVGFVSAAESKEELAKLDVPFITNVGRKGGSPVTVAALNAIAILAEKA